MSLAEKIDRLADKKVSEYEVVQLVDQIIEIIDLGLTAEGLPYHAVTAYATNSDKKEVIVNVGHDECKTADEITITFTKSRSGFWFVKVDDTSGNPLDFTPEMVMNW